MNDHEMSVVCVAQKLGHSTVDVEGVVSTYLEMMTARGWSVVRGESQLTPINNVIYIENMREHKTPA